MTARPVGSIALDTFKGHTPGPWTFRRVYGKRSVPDAVLLETKALSDPADPCVFAVREDWLAVCEPGRNERNDRMSADLRLIAAAPDLLESIALVTQDRDEAVSELNAAITRLTALTKERDAALAQVEALRAAMAKAESWRTLLTEAADGNAIDMLERERRRNELGDVIAAVLGLGRKDGHK